MVRLGRKPHSDPPEYWKIAISQSTASTVGLLLSDPLTGKIKHGARAKLINRLLREWIAEQQTK